MTNDMGEMGLSYAGGSNIPDQLMYPHLSQQIVETALPAQVFRQLFFQYPTKDQSVTVPIEDGSKTAVAARVGEGDQIPLVVSGMTSTTATVYKIGQGYFISKEWIIFQQFPLVQHQLKRLGMVMGNTIDYDCAQVVLGGAGTTTSCVGTSIGMDMTVTTISGSIGQYDIIEACARMYSNNLTPTTLVVNPVGYSYLRRLPMYNSQMLYGKPVYENGEMGHIEGLVVLVSVNCPTGYAFVINANLNGTPLGQFTPMGYFVEAMPIQTIMKDAPHLDGFEVYSTALYVPAVVKGECIEALTY